MKISVRKRVAGGIVIFLQSSILTPRIADASLDDFHAPDNMSGLVAESIITVLDDSAGSGSTLDTQSGDQFMLPNQSELIAAWGLNLYPGGSESEGCDPTGGELIFCDGFEKAGSGN